MLTSRPFLLPYLPHDLHEVDPGDERLLLRKEKRIRISSFACSHELLPFIRCVMFSILVPRILPYLHSWHYRWFRRGCQGHRGFLSLCRGVATRSQGHRGFLNFCRGVTTTPPLFRPLLAEVDQNAPLDEGIRSYCLYHSLQIWRKSLFFPQDLHTNASWSYRPFFLNGLHRGNHHPDLVVTLSSNQA